MTQTQKTNDNPNQLTTLSFQLGPSIGWVLAIIFSFVAAYFHGITIGETHLGTWLVLGGLSMWFPLSGFILPLLIILIISILGSARRITFTEQETEVIVEEKFLVFPMKKTREVIQKSEIKVLKGQQGHVGINIVYVVFFLLHLVYVWNAGIHLLTNPHVFGLGVPQGIMLIVAGIIDLVLILAFLIPGDERIEIQTHENDQLIHKMNLVGNRTETLNQILQKLGIAEEESQSVSDTPELQQGPLKCSIPVIVGVIFFIFALLSHIFKYFAGEPLRYVLYLLAVILIVKGLKSEQIVAPKESTSEILVDQRNQSLLVTKKSTLAKESVFFRGDDVNTLQHEFKSGLISLHPLEVLFFPIVALLTTMTITSWFQFLPAENTLQVHSFVTVFLGIVIFLLILGYLLWPVMNLAIALKDETFAIELSQIRHGVEESDRKPQTTGEWIKTSLESNKKVATIRFIVILIASILGIIIPFLV